MASTITFKLEGFQDFSKELKVLMEKDIINAAYSGSAGGAGTVQAAVKTNIRTQGLVASGTMLRGVYMKKERMRNGRVTYIIGVRHGKRRTKKQKTAGEDPYYWWFHEFGTSRMPGRPFLTPALAGNKSKVAERIRENMRKKLVRNKLIK